ncbi:MAG: MarR family winged helix-turn-helix transcriptional regulator [Candidatus Dormibacteria bacterium]
MIRDPKFSPRLSARDESARELLAREFTELQWRLRLRLKGSMATHRGASADQLASLLASTTILQRQAVMLLTRQEAVSMSDLARQLVISPSSATELVDRLVERQWVERQPDSTDRRAVLIRLTPEAREQADQVRRLIMTGVNQLLSPLGDTELADLVGLLRRLVDLDAESRGEARTTGPEDTDRP